MKDFEWDNFWNRKYHRYNRHHRDIWEKCFPFIKGKVADLGCGPCVIYTGKDVDITGVDWSEAALREAKYRFPKGTYIKADARNTGLPDKTFDTVLMLGLLDYFDDWEDVLNEARRIKKPGGKIIATLLDGFNGHNWKHYPHITSNWYLYQE